MSAPEPSISVVIATRDRPELLRRVSRQLAAQLDRGDELIIVDDSPGPDVQRPWLAPGDRVLRSRGQGPASARNLGWRAASGEVIAFTDDDVTIEPGWIAAIRTAFASDPALVAAEGRTVSRPFDPLYEYSVQSTGAHNGLTCNVAYRQDALTQLGGFDEGFRVAHCEDVDLFLRAQQLGPVSFVPEMRVEHEPRSMRPGALGARGGWLDSERRLFRRHPQLSPHGLPATLGAALAYAVWPVQALLVPARAQLLPRPARLGRALAITLVWWYHALGTLRRMIADDLRGVRAGLARRGVATGVTVARRVPVTPLRVINQTLHRTVFGRQVLNLIAAQMADHTVVIAQGRLAGLRFAPGGGQPSYVLGVSEPDLQEALARLVAPGDVVYDIGANVGFFTLLCARLTTGDGHVYAFEPMAGSAAALRRNLALNDIGHAEVVETAVGATDGTVTMDPGNNSATAHLAEVAGDGVTVRCTTVDAFVAAGHRPPTVVKIDVEGAEDLVLSGMRTTLARDRPAVLCELHYASDDPRREVIAQLLEDAGYERQLLALGDGAMPHLLAVPREAQRAVTGAPVASSE